MTMADQGVDDAALDAAVLDHPDGATVAFRVSPRAPATRLTGRHGDALRLKVHAPPVDGAANEAVRRFVATACSVPAGDIRLVSGERSRQKVVLVRHLDAAAVRQCLRES